MEKVKYMGLLKLNYAVVILVNGETFLRCLRFWVNNIYFFGIEVLQSPAMAVSHFNWLSLLQGAGFAGSRIGFKLCFIKQELCNVLYSKKKIGHVFRLCNFCVNWYHFM